MQTDPLRIQQLEHVIKNQLLPVYKLYYLERGESVPELEIVDLFAKQVPALCRSWPLEKSTGVLAFTSDG